MYESLDSVEDNVVSLGSLNYKGVTKLEDRHRLISLVSYTVWRKKFCILEEVKLCYGAEIDSVTFFLGHIVIWQGFLKVGLRLPLNILVVSTLNYF